MRLWLRYCVWCSTTVVPGGDARQTNTESTMATNENRFGDLMNYRTGEYIRPATADEYLASVAAARMDGGAGVIETDDGLVAYVEGGPAVGGAE